MNNQPGGISPLSKILDLFTSVCAAVLTIFIGPKVYAWSKAFIAQYLSENVGANTVDLGMYGWAAACALLVYASLKLGLFVLSSQFIASRY